MEFERILRPENPACSAPELLRWTSDFLVLANKAICVIACARGLDCPPELHRTAQRNLRAWAGYLDKHPSIASELEWASSENEDRSRSDDRRNVAGTKGIRNGEVMEVCDIMASNRSAMAVVSATGQWTKSDRTMASIEPAVTDVRERAGHLFLTSLELEAALRPRLLGGRTARLQATCVSRFERGSPSPARLRKTRSRHTARFGRCPRPPHHRRVC